MHKPLQLFLLLAVLLGLAMPGLASDEKKYRFEFFGGVNYPLRKNFQIGYPQASPPIKGTQAFSAGPRAGVRFGIDGARHWGQDYTYSYAQNDSRIETSDGRIAFTNHFHEASSNVLFYPGNIEKHKVHFFMTGGLGAMWVVVNTNTMQSTLNPAETLLGPFRNEVKFSFNAGAGVRCRLSERYGIRLDLRDYMSPGVRYGLPASSPIARVPVFPIENPFHQLVGTFSFIVHF